MVTAMESAVDNRVSAWNHEIQNNIQTISAMMSRMQIPNPHQQQLMIMQNNAGDQPPLIGPRNRHPADDGSHMNSSASKIQKPNDDTSTERHRSPPKSLDG